MKKTAIIASVLVTGIGIAAATSAFAASGSQNPFGFGNQNQMMQQGGGFGGGPGMGGPGMGGHGPQLTDAEKTALESMSDTEKKAFFDSKRTAEEAKRDAREAVIDKLLNGETLTDADRALVTEIKAERAERKAKEAEMKAKHDAVKAALDKKAAGQALTTEEQALIDSMPQQGPSMQNGQQGNNSMRSKNKQRRGGQFGQNGAPQAQNTGATIAQ